MDGPRSAHPQEHTVGHTGRGYRALQISEGDGFGWGWGDRWVNWAEWKNGGGHGQETRQGCRELWGGQ